MNKHDDIKLIDFEILDDVKGLVNNDKFPVILNYFLEDLDNYVADIVKGLENSDVKAIINASHTLKSSANQIGAIMLGNISSIIEEKGVDIEKGKGIIAEMKYMVHELELVASDTKRVYEHYKVTNGL